MNYINVQRKAVCCYVCGKCVDMIVTEMAVFKIENKKMTLIEHAEGVTIEDIKAVTPAEYAVSPDLKVMEL